MFSEMGSMEQSQGFLPSIPDRISQNVGKSLKFIQKKLNLQAMKGCQPVLGCELGRNRQGDRKVEGTGPKSVLSLQGSGSQSTHGSAHPREVLRCSPRKRRGEPQPLRFSPARPEANSCSRTRRGKCKGRRPPGLGGAPLSGE